VSRIVNVLLYYQFHFIQYLTVAGFVDTDTCVVSDTAWSKLLRISLQMVQIIVYAVQRFAHVHVRIFKCTLPGALLRGVK
jgi:hypothetical protein